MSTTAQPGMNPDHASTYRDLLCQAMKFEFETTKKVIGAIPSINADYRPDPKAKTAAELAWHIAQSHIWFLDGIANLRFAMDDPGEEKIPTPAETIAYYEKEFPRALDRVRKMTGGQLTTIVDFFGMKFPVFSYINFAHSHTVHHRGQLSTYLRPMGGKCPSIYGGSADEPWQG